MMPLDDGGLEAGLLGDDRVLADGQARRGVEAGVVGPCATNVACVPTFVMVTVASGTAPPARCRSRCR